MYVYIYMYMYIHTNVYMYVYIYIHIRVYTYVYTSISYRLPYTTASHYRDPEKAPGRSSPAHGANRAGGATKARINFGLNGTATGMSRSPNGHIRP